jgi:hypothetical protein
MKVFTSFAQYTPEYWAMRRGVPTASEFSRIITAAKGEFAAGHKSYINDLIGDELDSEYPRLNDGASIAMKRGTALEPEARGLYELWANLPIHQVGFVTTDCGHFGCSPDSLVGDEGVLELKSPMPSTHAGYVLDGKLPETYKAQCHGHLIVTGRKWCDFMSYLPGQEPFIIRVIPDDFTVKLAKCLKLFDDAYRPARAKFGLPNPLPPLALGYWPEGQSAAERLINHAADTKPALFTEASA